MVNFMNRKFEMIKAPEGPLDWKVRNIYSSNDIPASFSLEKYLTPVKNQGETGFCHSYVGASVKESQEYIERSYYQEFSPLSLAKEVKQIDGISYSEGTTGDYVVKALKNDGIVPEQYYPSNNYVVGSLNFPPVVYDGDKYKIENYARCYNSADIKRAIAQGKMVLFAFMASRSFVDCSGKTEMPSISMYPEGGGNAHFVGGHMVVAYGYDETGVYIQNSWGTEWGYQGRAKMLDSYIDFRSKDMGWTPFMDAFCTVDLENDPINTEKIVLWPDTPNAIINGEDITLDANPVIKEGRTFVPTRFVSEALGYSVIWNSMNRSIEITNNEIKINLELNSDIATVNGERVKLDYPVYVDPDTDRSMVPLRFVSETMGATVLWDGKQRKITILK